MELNPLIWSYLDIVKTHDPKADISEDATLKLAFVLEFSNRIKSDENLQFYRNYLPPELLSRQLNEAEQRGIVRELVAIVKAVQQYGNAGCIWAIGKAERDLVVEACVDLLKDLPQDAGDRIVYQTVVNLINNAYRDHDGTLRSQYIDLFRKEQVLDLLKPFTQVQDVDTKKMVELAYEIVLEHLDSRTNTMHKLTMLNTEAFLERFSHCYDGVVQSIHLDMAKGGFDYTFTVILHVKDAASWVELKLYFESVSEYVIRHGHGGFIQVLSGGVALMFENQVYFDFTCDDAQEIPKIRESDLYFAAENVFWEILRPITAEMERQRTWENAAEYYRAMMDNPPHSLQAKQMFDLVAAIRSQPEFEETFGWAARDTLTMTVSDRVEFLKITAKNLEDTFMVYIDNLQFGAVELVYVKPAKVISTLKEYIQKLK